MVQTKKQGGVCFQVVLIRGELGGVDRTPVYIIYTRFCFLIYLVPFCHFFFFKILTHLFKLSQEEETPKSKNDYDSEKSWNSTNWAGSSVPSQDEKEEDKEEDKEEVEYVNELRLAFFVVYNIHIISTRLRPVPDFCRHGLKKCLHIIMY